MEANTKKTAKKHFFSIFPDDAVINKASIFDPNAVKQQKTVKNALTKFQKSLRGCRCLP